MQNYLKTAAATSSVFCAKVTFLKCEGAGGGLEIPLMAAAFLSVLYRAHRMAVQRCLGEPGTGASTKLLTNAISRLPGFCVAGGRSHGILLMGYAT